MRLTVSFFLFAVSCSPVLPVHIKASGRNEVHAPCNWTAGLAPMVAVRESCRPFPRPHHSSPGGELLAKSMGQDPCILEEESRSIINATELQCLLCDKETDGLKGDHGQW